VRFGTPEVFRRPSLPCQEQAREGERRHIRRGLIVLAGLVYWLTADYPGMHGQPYGPALFPRLIAVLMALGASGLIVAGGARKRSQAPLRRAARLDGLAAPCGQPSGA
jgi:hypothetical protein